MTLETGYQADMDSHNLQTASIYVNNMLLSRGLLRNSKPIDFAHLGNESEEAEETTARVINLVHDLIMRRDVGYNPDVSLCSMADNHSA